MVGIPKRPPSSQAPIFDGLDASRTAQSLQPPHLGYAIEVATGAYAAVALEDSLAEMSRVAAELPFLYAPLRTKRLARRGHLQIAPPA